MIETVYVVAFAMGIVNIFKKQLPVNAVPLVSIAAAVALGVGNAAIFGGDILAASKDVFVASGIAVGMFVAGDAVRKI